MGRQRILNGYCVIEKLVLNVHKNNYLSDYVQIHNAKKRKKNILLFLN